MAKQRKQNTNLIQYRINQKLKLLNNNPYAWVYEFSNPTIRTNFRIPARILDLANNAFKEFWGFYVNDEDVEKIEKIYDEVVDKAKDIIDLANKLGRGITHFKIENLKKMRKFEKERLIKESRAVTELIIPQNEKSKLIYEAIILIDKYDLPIKQNLTKEEIKKWISAVKEFMKTIQKAESEVIKYTAEKINPRYLGRYKALRNEVRKYLQSLQ